MKKLYEESSIQEIADNIRYGLKISDTMTVAEMPHYINQLGNPYVNPIIGVPSHIDETGKWIRPTEYEDVGQLTWENNEEVCYLSLKKNAGAPWVLGLYITASKGAQVEYGHVVNGEFITSGSAELITNNKAYIKSLPENEDTLVAKITSQNYLYPITSFNFYQFTAAQAGTAITVPYYFQSVVERVGNLPYLTTVANSATTRGFGCALMERDALKFGHFTTLTSLAGAWQYCYALEELDVNDIDTSRWRVTNCSNMFYYCVKIKKIDLSGWDTHNWAVTTLSSMFQYCYNLLELDISTWDTSGWAVTTIANMFNFCQNLLELNINDWDTSNWAITTLASTFTYCSTLTDLDLSHWNTSNWVVATMATTFSNCYSLRTLKISTWNTTNWPLTSIANTWQYCLSLVELDLSKWNTTNWALTTFSYAWDNCRSLRRLHINDWNTKNWAITTMSYSFQYCINLEEIPIENWNTSNWPLATCTSAFACCQFLKKLDLSKWNNSKFVITDCKTNTTNCRNLGYLDISTLIPKPGATVATANFFLSSEVNYCLIEYYPQPGMSVSHSYSNYMGLSRDSILRILNALPQVSGKTLTLGTLRAKITTADIAIATGKGWTVA